MDNELLEWLEEQKRDTFNNSIRQLANHLDLSHSYVTKVLNQQVGITWNFCAIVAEKFSLNHVETFEKAGLLIKDDELPVSA